MPPPPPKKRSSRDEFLIDPIHDDTERARTTQKSTGTMMTYNGTQFDHRPLTHTWQCKSVVYALIIINKAGGLVYNRDFSSPLSKLSSNDYLVLAGTFHGVHAITRSLTPSPITSAIPRSQLTGLEVLETSSFRLTCSQTPTGVKFLIFTEPNQPNCDAIVGKVYELYADYVTKNPFYALEMPVRCEEFDRRLGAWIRGR